MGQKTFTEINNYRSGVIQENVVIFDTNILIDLFYPGNINRRSQQILNKLGDIYFDCLQQGKEIKIIIPIVSEFYNLAFKVALDNHNRNNGLRLKRKQFRKEPNFNIYNTGIISIIDNFSSQFKIEQYNFNYNNIVDKETKLLKLDFTDLIISTFCEEENACLVTLDSDFRKTFRRNLKFSIISN